MARFMLLATTLIVGVGIPSVTVAKVTVEEKYKNGWLEFFFPNLRKEQPDPSKELIAPFADPGVKPVERDAEGNPILQLDSGATRDLSQPHIMDVEVMEWVEKSVSEVVNFVNEPIEAVLGRGSKNFSPAALQQFRSFLEKEGVYEVMSSGKYNAHGFSQFPRPLNEAALRGRYRWLYEVDITISYVEKKETDLKFVDMKPVNQKIVARVQVGRHPEAGTELGLLIDLFEAVSVENGSM